MPANALAVPVMNNAELNNLTQRIAQESEYIDTLMLAIGTVIVGQHDLIQKLLIAMLSRGHVLLEGVPGLAKTLMVSTLSSLIQTKFQRLQFTPDLLPAAPIGTLLHHPQDGPFQPHLGTIFPNPFLAHSLHR